VKEADPLREQRRCRQLLGFADGIQLRDPATRFIFLNQFTRSYSPSGFNMGGEGSQKLSVLENATVGVAAGTIEITILQPM
jgi:hypothetical protein